MTETLDTAFTLPFWFEFAATITGGLSGGMSAVRARYDIFGTVAIACITGMGGGIIRDVLLQGYGTFGLYAFSSPWFLLSCAFAGVLVFYFGKLATYLDPIVDLLDNISVALWAIIGASKSLSAGLGIVPSVVLGTITAIGGGVLRDVLMNRSPVAFQTGPIYGSAALIGCAVYCPLKMNGILPEYAGALCAAFILGLRYFSLIMGWRTKPPRDYSDTVVESVKRPMQFIARKVHVPVGKTARERQANSRWERFKRQGKRLYDRLSGRWMDDMGEHLQPTVVMDKVEIPLADDDPHAAGASGASGASRASGPSDALKFGQAVDEHGEGASESAGVDGAAPDDGAGAGAPDPSDRIFVNRDELYRIIGLDLNDPDEEDPESGFDPFEPQTPEPRKPVNNPRDQKRP